MIDCPYGPCPQPERCGAALGCQAFMQDPGALWQLPDPTPPPCQGCSMVTDTMTECLHVCDGMTSEADLIERAAAWRAFRDVVDRQTAARDAKVPDARN